MDACPRSLRRTSVSRYNLYNRTATTLSMQIHLRVRCGTRLTRIYSANFYGNSPRRDRDYAFGGSRRDELLSWQSCTQARTFDPTGSAAYGGRLGHLDGSRTVSSFWQIWKRRCNISGEFFCLILKIGVDSLLCRDGPGPTTQTKLCAF